MIPTCFRALSSPLGSYRPVNEDNRGLVEIHRSGIEALTRWHRSKPGEEDQDV